MRLFNLVYTENKSEVIAPPKCLMVLDVWVLSGYLFVLYIKTPVYFKWMEKLNADRIVKLLLKYEKEVRDLKEKRDKFDKFENSINKQTNKIIYGNNGKKRKNSH